MSTVQRNINDGVGQKPGSTGPARGSPRGDIAFPVGKADEESCPWSARGQFFISWQQREGAFVLAGTGCHQLCLWTACYAESEKEEEAGLVLRQLVTQERRKLSIYCKLFSTHDLI